MRTTVDIANDQYSRLKSEAAIERTSVKSLISEGVDLVLRKRELGRITSKKAKPRWPARHGGNPEWLATINNDAMFGFEDEARLPTCLTLTSSSHSHWANIHTQEQRRHGTRASTGHVWSCDASSSSNF